MNHSFKCSIDGVSVIPMSEEYSELYRQLRNKRENRKFFFTDGRISSKQQKRWYREYLNDDTQVMFAILVENQVVGGCGLYHIDRKEKIAEFGRILIDKNYRRVGIGERAIQCVMDIAKQELNLRKEYLEVKENNFSALKAYERAGFRIIRDDYENGRLLMEAMLI